MLRNDCESFKKNKVNQSFSNAIEDCTLGISGWSTLEQSRWPYRQQLCWGVRRGNSTLLTSEPLHSLIWLAVRSQDTWGNSNLWSLLLLEKNVLWKEVTQKKLHRHMGDYVYTKYILCGLWGGWVPSTYSHCVSMWAPASFHLRFQPSVTCKHLFYRLMVDLGYMCISLLKMYNICLFYILWV